MEEFTDINNVIYINQISGNMRHWSESLKITHSHSKYHRWVGCALVFC